MKIYSAKVVGVYSGTSKTGKPYRRAYFTYSVPGVIGCACDSAFLPFDMDTSVNVGTELNVIFTRSATGTHATILDI